MWQPVFSRAFSQKFRGFTAARQADVQKAVDRVLADPKLNSYKRYYLDPYQQEHPSDKTLTLFFVIPSKPPGRVFFVWINDDQHPHDTHKNFGEDPCVKEFVRLRDGGHLEQYTQDFHEGKFTVVPRPNAPTFLKFEKYGVSVHANIVDDGSTFYAMAIASMARPSDLFDHYRLFIEHTRQHFIAQKKPFEFRVLPGDAAFQDLLQKNANQSHWSHSQDGGMDVWTVR